MNQFRRFLPDLIAIVAFVIISLVYFFPADIEGRMLFQSDSVAGAGAGQETALFHETTGEQSRWTGSVFSGMPTYQISPSYDSTQVLTMAQKVYRLFLPTTVNLVFIMLLGFYILLRVMGMSAWLSMLGSVMWAFSSYFFILISAGHIWKYLVLAYIPPTIAGMVLSYKGSYLKGGILLAIFTALQIQANHVQMSYYFLFVMLMMFIAYGVSAYRRHAMRDFMKATGVVVVAGLLGVALNLSNLYHTYSYSKHTMRAKSELTQAADPGNTSSGLDRDYITQWSYGIDETLTLLIPNFKGGASLPLSESEKAMEKANNRYSSIYGSLTQYYGTQPMTSGPVYVGAFVMTLFFLGCMIVKGEMKWALIAATVLSILLSWGKNFMGLTDLFIDYMPMYNKFRAVSSILVIAEFTIPLLAIMAFAKVLKEPEILIKNRKAVAVSVGLSAGVCLLVYLLPDAFTSFIPASEAQMLQNAVNQGNIPQSELAGIMASLSDMRENMLTSDAMRSLLFILAGCIMLMLLAFRKTNALQTTILVTLLVLVDMWSVNKRYLSDKDFMDSDIKETTFHKTETDELILQDKDPSYRVLNFASNTFNENNTSYYHKSIGGYHAAKMRRYQELIERYIQPQMSTAYEELIAHDGDLAEADPCSFQVLNMLNARYLILPISNNETLPLENPHAFGNGWFVEDVVYVSNADEELGRIQDLDLKTQAVVDKSFEKVLGGVTSQTVQEDASITMTDYKPNQVTFLTHNAQDGIAVFSEIYYPDGWKVTVDGKPAEIARANYVLRCMRVPSGDHTIIMTFDPDSLKVTEAIAYGAMVLLLASIIILVIREKKKLRA